MTTVSRTIGQDQIVEELVISFTHTVPIDWLLPGVAPTGKAVITNIFHLENGQWKLVHHHTDLSPQLEKAIASVHKLKSQN